MNGEGRWTGNATVVGEMNGANAALIGKSHGVLGCSSPLELSDEVCDSRLSLKTDEPRLTIATALRGVSNVDFGSAGGPAHSRTLARLRCHHSGATSKSSSRWRWSVLNRRMDFTMAALLLSSNHAAEHHG